MNDTRLRAAVQRMRALASLPTQSGEPSQRSVIDGLTDRGGDERSAAVSSLEEAFAAVNLALNGDVPSASTNAVGEIPRELVYAVDLLLDAAELADDPVVTRRLRVMWSAILAGDIDDLRAHADLEEWARRGRRP